MVKLNRRRYFWYKLNLFLVFLLWESCLQAQNPDVKINGNDVGTWFGNNWFWVVCIIALLVFVLIFFGGGSNRKKNITIISDKNGHIETTKSEETTSK